MNEFNEAKLLIDLIDYQAGSIVSKTVVDKATGTVTLFAFDKGQGLSEHTAPFDALVLSCINNWTYIHAPCYN